MRVGYLVQCRSFARKGNGTATTWPSAGSASNGQRIACRYSRLGKNTGHQYIGTIEEGDVLKHYLRKANPTESKEETKYPHVVALDELQKKVENNEQVFILDVREEAEYVFGHIPGAYHIPLGQLSERMNELNKDETIYVICRTGNRSDLAAQQLAEKDSHMYLTSFRV